MALTHPLNARTEMPAPIYSDGSDGSPIFDGSATILGLVPSSSVYTLTRDIYPVNMTVNTGVQIRTAGFCIFVQKRLTNSGIIQYDGNNANGGTAGASITSAGTLNTQAGGGGTGGTILGAGAVGSGSGGNNCGGGSGGNGGAANAQAGGAGNATAAPAAVAGTIRDLAFGSRRRLHNALLLASPNAGGGGGSGGVDVSIGTATAGGGGGGACGVLISCSVLSNIGTIRANGGNGGNAVTAGGGIAGGGGGGSGGWVWVACRRAISVGTMQALGGAFGTGSGGGGNGAAGGSGLVVFLQGV